MLSNKNLPARVYCCKLLNHRGYKAVFVPDFVMQNTKGNYFLQLVSLVVTFQRKKRLQNIAHHWRIQICIFPVRKIYLPFRTIETFRISEQNAKYETYQPIVSLQAVPIFRNQGYLILFTGTSTRLFVNTESRSGI